MAVKFEKITIGGQQWGMNTLATSDGLSAVTQLSAIAGAPVGALVGVKQQASLAENADLLSDAISKMTLRLADPSTVPLVQMLLKDLQKGNNKGGYEAVSFELEFAGNYGTLSQLVAWSIKMNFASFFDGNPVFSVLLEKAKASTRGISTGGSGES